MWQKVTKFKGAEYFRKALYIYIYIYVWFGQGGTRVGESMFSLLFLPRVVPNQRQLSIIVSDWGSYISCDFAFGFCWRVIFCLAVLLPDRTVCFRFFYFVILLRCSVYYK